MDIMPHLASQHRSQHHDRTRSRPPAAGPRWRPTSASASASASTSSPAEARRGGRGLRRLEDRAFEFLFSRILVYTILFEDNEKDLELLDLDDTDRVLSVGGAGCGVAAMLAHRPAGIDVVDFNQKHLAVTALKVNAAKQLGSYGEFHEAFARGRHPRPRRLVEQLARGMPAPLAAFWASHWRMFEKDFYSHGLYTKNLNLVRPFWPITPEYLKALNRKPRSERSEEMFTLLSRAMKGRILGALIRSPLSILAAGINYTQRERNLRAVGTTDVVDGVIEYATRLVQTDLEDNWIAWHIATGRFNHERPTCLPLYLRAAYHERALRSPTVVRYWHADLLGKLSGAPAGSWSRFCLSDVVDWMTQPARALLLREVVRTARPGARVICRSVEDSTLVDELGLSQQLRLIEPHSTLASRAERSCLYRRVNCYEVIK